MHLEEFALNSDGTVIWVKTNLSRFELTTLSDKISGMKRKP